MSRNVTGAAMRLLPRTYVADEESGSIPRLCGKTWNWSSWTINSSRRTISSSANIRDWKEPNGTALRLLNDDGIGGYVSISSGMRRRSVKTDQIWQTMAFVPEAFKGEERITVH